MDQRDTSVLPLRAHVECKHLSSLYTIFINGNEMILVFPCSRPGLEQQILDLANLSVSGKGDRQASTGRNIKELGTKKNFDWQQCRRC